MARVNPLEHNIGCESLNALTAARFDDHSQVLGAELMGITFSESDDKPTLRPRR